MEIQPIGSANPPHINPPQRTQAGYKSTHVAHAEQVVIHNNNYPLHASPSLFMWHGTHKSAPKTIEVNDEYYNLLVTSREIKNSRVILNKCRVLQTGSEIVQQLADLSSEAQERIKAFPSLIMYENKHFSGQAAPEQEAFFGFVTDIRVLENGIVKIRFHCIATVNQQAINNIADILDIHVKKGVMELNQTRWTIKNVNLIEELLEAGLLSGWPPAGEEVQQCQKSQKNGQASQRYPSTSA